MPKKASGKADETERFLSSYLPYLLNRLAMEMLRGADDKFARYGLSVAKWRVLAVLSDVGSCRFGELVHLTSVEPATLSRMVGALAAASLVRRRRLAEDGRSVNISLTTKGANLFKDTLPWSREVEDTLTAGMNTKEVAKLKAQLKQMYMCMYKANAWTRKSTPAELPPNEVWLSREETT